MNSRAKSKPKDSLKSLPKTLKQGKKNEKTPQKNRREKI